MPLANLYNWLLLLIRRSYGACESIQLAVIIMTSSSLLLRIIIFLPDLQLILGQTHDETENGKLATHIFESFRPCSVIDQYPITW